MQIARSWWKNDTIRELADILGVEERSARRYLMGERTPDADAAFALLLSDKGPHAFEVVVSTLPLHRQGPFLKDMAEAVERAELRRQSEELQAKMRAKGMK